MRGTHRAYGATLVPVQVDELVERSADPAAVRAALARFDDDRRERVLADPALAAAVVAVIAGSRSLTRFVEHDDRALDVLADLDAREPVDAGDLVGWKRREYLRIAARDLLDLDGLPATTEAISDLARDVLVAAVDAVSADEMAVVGMGKLGGRELNYASDIDVLFVGGDPKAARQVMDIARACFRVDANLRPEGRDGALTRSVDSYAAYWERWAQPWEKQALLKAVPVAGDAGVGHAFAQAAASVLWERPLTPDDLRYLRSLKQRAEDEVARRGLADREVKRGPGGIRDVEFAVQLLQLVHGSTDPEIRSPTTLVAIDELAAGAYVDTGDAVALAHAYEVLRSVEHAVQLDEEQQTHEVPADRAARRRLARVLGYRGTPAAGATDAFDEALARQRSVVRTIHERLWFRPLLDALVAEGASGLTVDAAAARLVAFGFTDPERTRQAVAELTRGIGRSSRVMQQLLPLLLDWLSTAPDPDLGLLTLRKLVTGGHRSMELASAFRDSPEAARALCRIVGTSRLLGDVLEANPDLVDRLGDPGRLRTRDRTELVDSARAALGWRGEIDEQQRALHRWKHRHLLGIAARDVLDHADVAEVGADLTALAEASVEVALAAVEPKLPFTVIAVGRFGGAELSYASDLDVVFAYEGDGAGDQEEALRVATDLTRFLAGATPALRIYPVDAGLRPEGKQGPLARSLDGYAAYIERWAQTWERQAMLRARVVAGDDDVGRAFTALVDRLVWGVPFDDDDVREVRRMKARIERERIPPGEDPEFHLKLGKGSLSDVEFTAQLLQLQHRVPAPGTIVALRALAAAGTSTPPTRRCSKPRTGSASWPATGGSSSRAPAATRCPSNPSSCRGSRARCTPPRPSCAATTAARRGGRGASSSASSTGAADRRGEAARGCRRPPWAREGGGRGAQAGGPAAARRSRRDGSAQDERADARDGARGLQGARHDARRPGRGRLGVRPHDPGPERRHPGAGLLAVRGGGAAPGAGVAARRRLDDRRSRHRGRHVPRAVRARGGRGGVGRLPPGAREPLPGCDRRRRGGHALGARRRRRREPGNRRGARRDRRRLGWGQPRRGHVPAAAWRGRPAAPAARLPGDRRDARPPVDGRERRGVPAHQGHDAVVRDQLPR
jgi:glutamate-ammonia-ligase adenylyltransferase